jgi:hypothetical protein
MNMPPVPGMPATIDEAWALRKTDAESDRAFVTAVGGDEFDWPLSFLEAHAVRYAWSHGISPDEYRLQLRRKRAQNERAQAESRRQAGADAARFKLERRELEAGGLAESRAEVKALSDLPRLGGAVWLGDGVIEERYRARVALAELEMRREQLALAEWRNAAIAKGKSITPNLTIESMEGE